MATRLMGTVALLLLAVCVLAVEGQTDSFPAMFKDFREGKSGSAKVASDSYGYEESELQAACLRLLSVKACADEDDSSRGSRKYELHEYWETDVGCCSEGYHKHRDIFRLPEDLKVGKCSWNYLGVGDDKVDAGVKLVGTYEMTCELEEHSEKCGEPLCEDLVLKGWGRVYKDWKAAIEGKPTIDEVCEIRDPARQAVPSQPTQQRELKPAEPVQQPAQRPADPVQRPDLKRPAELVQQPAQKPAVPVQQPAQRPAEPVQKPAQRPAEPTHRPAEPVQQPAQRPAEPVQKPAEPVHQPPQLEQKPEPAQKPALKPLQPIQKIHLSNTGTAKLATANSYYYTEHEPVYYKGMAVVFDGYVQVMSCSKKTVYKEGKMQAIVDYKIYDDDKTITPSEDQFIAKPYTMDLILRKANDY